MKIPTILCGPIIRRVEPSQVCIWIALSKPLKLGAQLYTVLRDHNHTYTYNLISNKITTDTLRLGDKLYITLVRLTPSEDLFPEDTLLAYNLYFKQGTKMLDLGDFDLLSPDNPESIVYGDLDLPTFYISGNKQSTFLYGSCRKPHGKGEDVLSEADQLVQDYYFHLENRPSTLFLMGDQIYADDIAHPLLPFISKLGTELVGKNEDLEKVDPRLKLYSERLDKIQGRKFIMEQLCNFTSRHADNHLMKLGEYSAMYLLNWSPELWKLLYEHPFDSFEEALVKDNIHFAFSTENDNYKKERDKLKTEYNEQIDLLIDFQQYLSSVRRLLANTPTYMIFDDHDITDDWNITAEWKISVCVEPLGRHVISNGLAAYWAFQGWGNDPELFSNQFIQTIASYCKSYEVNTSNYEEYIDVLWNYDHWHFVAPTNPKAVVLDTRTMRGYFPLPRPKKIGTKFQESVQGPELITMQGFEKVTEALKESGWKTETPLIIVSPSPLYGIDIIESFLINFLSPLRLLGVKATNVFDLEAWRFNGKGITNFLQTIASWNPSECFILSGDLHYGFSLNTTVEFKNNRKLKIHQLTSSPIKNMSFSGLLGHLLKGVEGRLASLTRKKKTIHRFCSQEYTLLKETKSFPCPTSFMWKETIQYAPTSSRSMIEMNNNLGLLIITLEDYENKLLNEKFSDESSNNS